MFVIAKTFLRRRMVVKNQQKIFSKKKSMKSKLNNVMASHKIKGSYFAQIYLLET